MHSLNLSISWFFKWTLFTADFCLFYFRKLVMYKCRKYLILQNPTISIFHSNSIASQSISRSPYHTTLNANHGRMQSLPRQPMPSRTIFSASLCDVAATFDDTIRPESTRHALFCTYIGFVHGHLGAGNRRVLTITNSFTNKYDFAE